MLTPNFRPETNAAAKRLSAMADHFARAGWRVSVITHMPHYPQHVIHDGFDRTSPDVRDEAGITVVRIRPWIVRKDALALRLLSESLFALQALAHVLRRPRSLVLASSPFMFLGPVGLLAARCTGSRFVWDVRDLTWLYPKAAGRRTFGVDRLLEALMRFTGRSADVLVSATHGLLAYFAERPQRAATIPNGVSDEVLQALEPVSRSPILTGGRPHVVYTGLFGYNHGLLTLIEAAKLLGDVDFTLVGDGPERDALRAAADGAMNVTIAPYQRFDDLCETYRGADVLVSHVRRNPIFLWTQPAKLWEYMASGRPVVHAGEGEVIDVLEGHAIARTVPPDDARALARALGDLLADPEEARALGARGRTFVETHRRRETLMADLISLVAASAPEAR